MVDDLGRSRRGRRGRLMVGLGGLALFFGVVAAAISIFNVGLITGLALSGGVLLVCAVPAAAAGWPLPGVDDVVALVSGIVGAIVDVVRSVFDW